jgi:molecular chaperone DnaK
LVHSVNKNLTEHGDKIDQETKDGITKAIEEAKAVEKSEDLEKIKAASAALSNAAMKIGQAMYAKGGSAGGENTEPKTEENEQNAQYEEKK